MSSPECRSLASTSTSSIFPLTRLSHVDHRKICQINSGARPLSRLLDAQLICWDPLAPSAVLPPTLPYPHAPTPPHHRHPIRPKPRGSLSPGYWKVLAGVRGHASPNRFNANARMQAVDANVGESCRAD
jgi:hypothetical protein